MNPIYFEKTNLNPTGKIKSTDAHSAINAVAIVTGISWQDAVKKLVEQAHIRSNLPGYSTCITDMIRVLGFRKSDSSLRVKDLLGKIII